MLNGREDADEVETGGKETRTDGSFARCVEEEPFGELCRKLELFSCVNEMNDGAVKGFGATFLRVYPPVGIAIREEGAMGAVHHLVVVIRAFGLAVEEV